MGDYRVIAGVSRTLRTLLEDRMQSSSPEVTLLPPDEEPQDGIEERVNLFLFRVSESAQLKNQEFPVPGSAARRSPPLSLNLHYLLTAFNGQDTEGSQQLLGDAMRVLHDYSIITEKLPQQRAPGSNGEKPPVLDTRLHDEYEHLKISLQPVSVDEMSEIWTAFTVPYRLSVAYSVSVVQIESRRARATVRLVGEPPEAGPKVYSVPFRRPKIMEIRVVRHDDPSEKEQRYPHARIGDTLVVIGRNLSGGEATHITIGEMAITDEAALQDTRIEIPIPDDERLQPGPQSVQVRQDLIDRPDLQEPLQFASNRGFFMLVPDIADLTLDSTVSPRTLTITGTRLFQEDVECMTLIGGEVIDSGEYEPVDADTPMSEAFTIHVPEDALPEGEHPVRVRVGGVESIDDATIDL